MKRAALLAVFTVGLTGCNEKAADAPLVRPVLTTEAKPTTTAMFGPFTGFVAARYESTLGFQIAGRMLSRDVTTGDIVKKGMLLAKLDPKVAEFQLTSAQADVANTQAQLTNASATEERQRILAQGGNTPQSQLDAAVANRDTATARLDQAKASLQKAQDQLRYTRLLSEFDGVVSSWSAEVGQVVSAGQTVFTIARPDVREAVIDVPDALLGDVRQDTKFTVRLQSDEAIATGGIVREIGALSDSSTRTRRVRLSMPNPPQAFRLGSTVTIAAEKAVQPFTVLPAAALLEKNGKTFVWVLDPAADTVATHAVHLLERDGRRITVAAADLPAHARVVTAGIHSLEEGQTVKHTAEAQE